eukprot:TRINITY_DN276_c0_g2_i1.p1 TRINITY_DN276_c0_g2~~TRINITY_DN276_c0_g2_i1.p1  ORF type:complete len:633 (+),score=230.65 TRINITY_DN276_c0_g2_i1:473-2371(+)
MESPLFLEALVGHPFTYVERGRSTLRPLFFSLVNNLECSTPRVTLKRDTFVDGLNSDIEISLENLEQEIQRRNVFTQVPIYLTYEHKNCFNVTLIDTPGLLLGAEEKREEVLELVLELTLPSHRYIVCVEEAKEWEEMGMIDIVKKVDPKLSRSLFVYTNFRAKLKNFSTANEMNKYLSLAPAEKKGFFVSLVPGKYRETYETPKAYQDAIKEIEKEDLKVLDTLHSDRKFLGRIGLQSIKRHLLELIWRKYQEGFPKVLKQIRQVKKHTEDDLYDLQMTYDHLEESQLRALATSYSSLFLDSLEKLITGTLEGNLSLNGQTLAEEREQEETGPWLDSNHRPMKLANLSVAYADNKLYGGQQFERLLLEFKAVCEKITIPDITMHDIATATGPHKLTDFSSFTWAASDIAQKRLEKTFKPLIQQLFKRATYILKRLPETVDFMVLNKNKEKERDRVLAVGETTNVHLQLESYPYFLGIVKEFYLKYLERQAKVAVDKCLDEFYCTRIIHWELMNEFRNISPEPDQAKKMVVQYATEKFTEIRKRITKNVMLKIYNFLLVPLQTEMWGEITSQITSLTLENINEIFEVEVTRSKLDKEKEELVATGEKAKDHEKVYLDLSNKFAHPKGLIQVN